MMCKRWIAIFLAAVSCVLLSTVSADAAQARTYDVLLVYPDTLSESSRSDVGAIADILTDLGYSVCYRSESQCESGLSEFPYILFYHGTSAADGGFLRQLDASGSKVLVVGGPAGDVLEALHLPQQSEWRQGSVSQVTGELELGTTRTQLVNTPCNLLSGKFSYTSGMVVSDGENAPYCAGTGRFRCVAVFDSANSVLTAMFTRQVAQWKWPYQDEPHSYPQYVVFDNVYPYTDPNLITATADRMKALGIPYAVTVMPVYQNGEFPAMKHFCESLRYAQANGAAIVLHAPLINTAAPTVQELDRQISIAFASYSSYGVYPVALEAPGSWTHQTMGLSVLRRFRTVILTGAAGESWSPQEKDNAVYADGHQIIASALAPVGDPSFISSFPSAVFLNMGEDSSQLAGQLEAIRESPVGLKSLWGSSQSVYTDTQFLSYQNNSLKLQGKTVTLDYQPFSYPAYQYNRNLFGEVSADLGKENRGLILAVLLISLLFLLFIVFARIQNRKKFLIGPQEDRQKGWNDRK